MTDYQAFLNHLSEHAQLANWSKELPLQIAAGLNEARFGDLPRWREALAALPDLSPDTIALNASRVGADGSISDGQREQLRDALKGLHPWRKGPYELFGVHIDTEWRSDWKWNRLKDAISPLEGRTVLDVGCGSGYHCWRMRGAGANLVVGIDPTPLFVMQYFALQKYLQNDRVAVLPMGIEHLPEKLQAFDTTFSMGILYHRRSPFDHLIALRDSLRPGGQLVLETLVIEGQAGEVLVPEGRYSKMGNVWFIPSTATLEAWLKKAGFKSPKLIDVSQTSRDEQRSTDWMSFHSLAEFLNPDNPNQTIEGYPAPRRATFIAEKP
jgi:tRNA (mo5U34)-methyltransferase